MVEKTAIQRWDEMIALCNEKTEYIDMIFVSATFINQLADELGYKYVRRYTHDIDSFSWMSIKGNIPWVRSFECVPGGICCRVQLKNKKPDHTYLYLPEDIDSVIAKYPDLEEQIRANND